MVNISVYQGLRMVKGVPRHYFNKKSEVNVAIDAAQLEGKAVYKTPLFCECTEEINYRGKGAVVISMETREVLCYFIRCKNCAKMTEEPIENEGVINE